MDAEDSANGDQVNMEVNEDGANDDQVDMEVDDNVYIEDDILVEDKFIDDYLAQIGDNILAKLKEEPRRHLYFGRSYVPRLRQAAHDDLFACYFSDNPIYTKKIFRQRFRMNRPLFL
jgi:hypothetical protein